MWKCNRTVATLLLLSFATTLPACSAIRRAFNSTATAAKSIGAAAETHAEATRETSRNLNDILLLIAEILGPLAFAGTYGKSAYRVWAAKRRRRASGSSEPPASSAAGS